MVAPAEHGGPGAVRPAAALLLLSACTGLSPLRGRAVVGRDAYVIFVADGPEGGSDLFGVRTDGGPVFQVTYTNVREAAPALAPDGGAVAFLRGAGSDDSVPAAVWVLNLLTGAERELALPVGAPAPERVGWSADGQSIYVRAGTTRYLLHAPPAPAAARALTGAARAAADSSLWVLLGDPPFGRAVPCGAALCVEAGTGGPSRFADNAHDAARWGRDSVGYLSGGDLVVRPLGPGRERRVDWSGVPAKPRELTVFVGRRER
ncbi:MAG: TolB family protein [Deltaproteobacteria bacterium]